MIAENARQPSAKITFHVLTYMISQNRTQCSENELLWKADQQSISYEYCFVWFFSIQPCLFVGLGFGMWSAILLIPHEFVWSFGLWAGVSSLTDSPQSACPPIERPRWGTRGPRPALRQRCYRGTFALLELFTAPFRAVNQNKLAVKANLPLQCYKMTTLTL